VSITRLAIDRNRVTAVALVVIMLAGLYAYRGLPRDETPPFIIRTALVQTLFPGASPERVEQLVTDKLEKAIQEMPEIDFISSRSKTGASVIYVNIKEEHRNMRPIWDNLRRKVDKAGSELPEGIIGPIVNDEFGDVFGIVFAITGEGFTYAELKEVADVCRNELLLINEAAKVDIYGAQEERVFVEYNNARLAELRLSPLQLKNILETRNIIIPGGQIFTDREQLVLEPTGNFESVEDLRRTVIKLPGRSELVYLGDLARVYRGYIDPPNSTLHYMGRPCLALGVNLRQGGNLLELGEQVKEQVARFQTVYPIGVDFEFVAFQPFFVEKKVNDFVDSLLMAVAIVLLVMLVSLGLRTGLVVASLIPAAMIMALFLMSLLDIGLDQMSLASLIIALGMLVDNAIVMSESIMVQMRNGKTAKAAAINAASELRIPLLTSSLTTAAAFLTIFLAESTTGEYTAPLFKVVTITLISSWILSLTMTPLLCVRFMRVKVVASDAIPFNSRFYHKYRAFLLMVLKRRLLSLAGVVAVFMLAMFAFGWVPKIFFPPGDKPIVYAELKLPIGTPLKRTEKVVESIEGFMASELVADSTRSEGIVNWASFIGKGAPRYVLGVAPEPPSPHYAYILINTTTNDAALNRVIPHLEVYCQEQFPDLDATISDLTLGPPVKHPVEVRVSGADLDKVFDLADRVKERMLTHESLRNVTNDWGPRTKKLMVNINEARARRAGLTNRDIAFSLQTVLSGIKTTNYYEDDKLIPVTLRSIAAERDDIGKLQSHNVFSPLTGRSVPLMQVADVEVVWQPAEIHRRDRLKTVIVSANVAPGVNAIAAAQELDKWLKSEASGWEIGYKYELGGELESSGEANESIAAKFPIAMLIIVMLLVGQFNSVRRPVIILLTIPLGLIGVVIGLLVARSYFGFMTLLGVISLAGIVINNGIVLLERIKLEIEDNGLRPQRAIIEAAQHRLRPILLTTATTVGGLLPLWYSGEPMFKPMAIAIIFGLLFATILTLGVVPLLYSLFFRVSFKDFTYNKS